MLLSTCLFAVLCLWGGADNSTTEAGVEAYVGQFSAYVYEYREEYESWGQDHIWVENGWGLSYTRGAMTYGINSDGWKTDYTIEWRF